ncbi:flavin-containing monooxygenase, partial [Actinoplanes sp. RD1]|uniref:flavin-containing monooxygenase n=1 Tax=Actinoplanes sp. RD1 TaxID=3064538 RepID=UPI0027409387
RDTTFHTRVTELRWNEDSADWTVLTDRGDRMRARYVVVSSGVLSAPKLPGIPDIETFRGHTFHTSRWDYDYTGGDQNGGLNKLAGKRVGVVGTGATGIQVIPHLGRDAEHLYVFQRTPSSVDVRDNRPTDPQRAASLRPGWQSERMDNFLTVVTGGKAEVDLIADGWTSTAGLQRSLLTGHSDLTDEQLELADANKMNQIRARVDEIVTDPQVAALLKPWYRYMCKRPAFSDHYLQTFNRSNVTLVDTADHGGITRMTENAVVVGDREYEVDCVIFATGFEVGRSGIASGTLPVYGRDGMPLLGYWRDGARTLHGFYSHGFPNLFHLGLVQNASSVNFVHVLQEQATHIGAVVKAAVGSDARYVEPTLEAENAWIQTIRDTAPHTYEFQMSCTPGYNNNEGKPAAAMNSYGPGPIAFHDLLRRWRTEGGLADVLVGP